MSDPLQSKLRRFLDGTLLRDTAPLPAEELKSRSIRTISYADGLAMEEGAVLSSPILGLGPCFVGARSYVNDGGYVRCEGPGVFVGRFCSIGRRVTLGAGAHRIHGLSSSPALRGVRARSYTREESSVIRGVRSNGPLVIESDVWIGDGAVVMPGITIGVGAVIGANAVVTRNVAPYQIVGGIPARPIRSRFPDEIVERLIGSGWWNASVDELNSRPLANVVEFLEGPPVAIYPYPTYRPVGRGAAVHHAQ